MKSILITLLAFGSSAFAAGLGDINCTAEQFETTPSAIINHVKQPLLLQERVATNVILSVEIDGRAYTLNGDLQTGTYRLTQSWGPGYTQGIMTTGSFGIDGRLQIVQVNETKVYKLVCLKR